ncbi:MULTISPECIES: phosphoethanolamine transferase [Arcobacteraceae]|uniref:Phosphoethanolamine transferase n=2 Tax=Arcobacteraceae TaxID=2808963 RepID=A0A5C2HDS2_9BACT|nr:MULTISPECIES: phosphoethanolamine transferase [Arcobacteraceae]OCL95560.1 Phosphoethanolamine transferase EptA [Aliarcobacter thereius LMG 24486]OCL96657.1 Phosphoethanolamine transferase EptA [Aliarcobacter thereius]QBF16455.1 phosphoethanolamine transferase [Aliarcobacter thereius LMG 24486]QEP41093.1 phosphoethanolamine transferase [Arcobacter porcinus]TLS91552.1 phosphoethanolamine transferase [Aliarcobacter thereius]
MIYDKLKKIKYNIILAIIISILFISIEQFYRIYNDILIPTISLRGFAEQFFFHLLVISIVNLRVIISSYFLMSLFTWFQFVHFSYYGTWIFPTEYLLFFVEFKETYLTFSSVIHLSFFPLLLVIVLFLLSFFFIKRFNSRRIKIQYLGYIILIFLIFLPIRIYINDDYGKWSNPNYEYSPVANTITTLSNLFGNVIPKKISGKSGLEQEIVDTPDIIEKNPNINLIVIMGESSHRDFMSLYGYDLKTTPFLDNKKEDRNFIYKKAISSGVMTSVSIPSFFNMLEKPDSTPQIFSHNTCLFKMAKNNGFNTYFYSSQAREQLKEIKNFLCTKNIDILEDGTSYTNDVSKSALDETLLERINAVDFTKNNFLVLNFRASHTPYLNFIPTDFRPFNKENSIGKDEYIIDYINSIAYTDSVIEKLIQKIEKKSEKPTYIIFTSDHATSLEDKNRSGHGILENSSVYKVPFFLYSLNTKKNYSSHFEEFEYISHYQISHLIANILGYKSSYNKFNKKEDYFVTGNDLTGIGGYIQLYFDENNNIEQKNMMKEKKKKKFTFRDK